MENIQKLIEIIAKNNFEKIPKRSVDIYHENFIFQIKKLIEEFSLILLILLDHYFGVEIKGFQK